MASVDIAFTITLKPFLYKLDLEKQYDFLEQEVKSIFSKSTKKLKYTAVVEVTKNFNMHAHGTLRYEGQFRSLQSGLRYLYDLFRGNKIVGFVQFKVCDNTPKWTEYIIKHLSATADTVGLRHPVLADQLDLITPDCYFKTYYDTSDGTSVDIVASRTKKKFSD